MKLGKFTQSASDRILYNIDYSQFLASGETLSSVSFAVEQTTDPAFVIDTDTIDTATHSIVSFFASGGVASNTPYSVTVTVMTSAGQTKADYLFFFVQEIP